MGQTVPVRDGQLAATCAMLSTVLDAPPVLHLPPRASKLRSGLLQHGTANGSANTYGAFAHANAMMSNAVGVIGGVRVLNSVNFGQPRGW